ncbi:MAG: hypothetical protein AVDCRST_MAG35-2180 [uncultured Quadrisphaera sp.]|uniref:Uncharacterized protein n=1 Tax=uncultured Quadrisphaera sp. TaxID=904978 RepID=A0A6J4PRT6_9ACTN|nr:MAG: hypothetical protein AVDCRST_MAG35-2180 [uncultured Quadrisphaera sp.]
MGGVLVAARQLQRLTPGLPAAGRARAPDQQRGHPAAEGLVDPQPRAARDQLHGTHPGRWRGA